ncbi:MAG: tetratricopeptide repeat protein, partial [Anaerolineae bacterium]|nr:tetratricopeptide repeat protein [Anaerolineae bacterium]
MAQSLPLLKTLHEAHPHLGRELTNSIIEDQDLRLGESGSPLEQTRELLDLTELYKISGRYAEAVPLLEAAWEETLRLQAEMTTNLAKSAAADNNQAAARLAVEQAGKLGYSSPDHLSNLQALKFSTGQIDSDAIQPLELDADSSPTTILFAAQMAFDSGDRSRAQELAVQAQKTKQLSQQQLIDLGELYAKLNLFEKAEKIATQILRQSPNHIGAINMATECRISRADFDEAMNSAQLALALDPGNLDSQRNIARVLASKHDWQPAIETLEQIISRQSQPALDDFLSLASCAILAGRPDTAVSACQSGTALYPQASSLQVHAGNAYAASGDMAQALASYQNAIALDPAIPAAWTGISEIHLSQGAPSKAKENILSALQTMPNQPALRTFLGDMYTADNNLTSALQEYKQAFEAAKLDKQLPGAVEDLSLKLGAVLLELGHFEEAVEILHEAHLNNPTRPELAHAYARALIKSGAIEKALPAITIARQNAPNNSEVALDYARLHLDLSIHPREALIAAQQVLDSEPEHPIAKALAAESQLKLGSHKDALAAYKSAHESAGSLDQTWRVRLAKGMAQTAVILEQPELAVQTLQETLNTYPDNVPTLKALFEIFASTKELEDAENILLKINSIGSADPKTLLWVSDKAGSIDKTDTALQVLEEASRLHPEDSAVLVRLGGMYHASQQEEKAMKTFKSLYNSQIATPAELRSAAGTLIKSGDVNEGIQFLERALEMGGPDQELILAELYNAHVQNDAHDAALEILNKQIEIKPSSPRLYKNKAALHKQLGQPKAALVSLLQALEFDHRDHQLHIETALLLRESGDLNLANDHMKNALRLESKQPDLLIQASQLQ